MSLHKEIHSGEFILGKIFEEKGDINPSLLSCRKNDVILGYQITKKTI
jgi:hypothetical protein